MKHILFYIVLWLLLSVLSCTGGDARVRTVLAQADSLLPTLPDSALRLLQSFSPRDLPDREGRMYYALLLSHAKYRNYIPLGSDSLLQEVAAYYAGREDDRLEARARYLLGGFYEEQQDFGAALRANHEAAQLARRAGDYRLLCLVYNNQAYICLNHGLKERGDSLYAVLYDWARQAGDSVRMAEALLRRGAYVLSLGDSAYGRAERLIEEGSGLARKLRSPQLLHLAYSHLYILYDKMRHPQKALAVAKDFVAEVPDTANLPATYLFLGNAYYQLAQYDSAVVCLHLALDRGDPMIRESACALLAGISEAEDDFEQAVHWGKEREWNREQQRLIQHQLSVAVAAREVELGEEMHRQTAPNKVWIYCTILFFGGLGWLFYQVGSIRHRKRRTEGKQLVVGSPPDVQPEAPVQEIPEEQLVWSYDVFKQASQKAASFIMINSILDYYKRYAGYQQHWGSLNTLQFFREIDALLPGYLPALKQKFPDLDASDVFLLLLSMLEFSNPQISILLERDRSTVYRQRKHLFEQVTGKKDASLQDVLIICMLASKMQPMQPSDA